MDVQCFYEGSDLQNFFTKNEFNQLIKNIHCPRCNSPIWNCFWPYNFHFELPDEFENEIQEINKLSNETPFLLLTNSLAQKTLNIINSLGKNAKLITIDDDYYRARTLEKNKSYTNTDFTYPPKNRIHEGRYNHAGFPVIYLADSPSTCFYELRNPDEGIAVADFKFVRPLKILDLVELEDKENSILNIAAWSSLMSSPSEGNGWYKPHYTYTRFVSDCAINAGYDAIKYESVRVGKSHNMVLLNGEKGWDNLKLIHISKMKLDSNNELNYL